MICVASNVVPERMVALWKAFEAGELETARRIHLQLLPLFVGLFVESNPVPVKTLCAWSSRGLNAMVRLPLVPLQPSNEARLRVLAQEFGLLGST